MSNLSYCRFRNTVRDLDDCVSTLECCDGDLPLSDEEERAYHEMYKLCEIFLKEYERIEVVDD